MLVLSRRVNEKILFPGINTAVQVVSYKRGVVRLGIEAPRGTVLFRGKGCDECRGTGYRGRTGIYELFVIDEDARSLILRRASTRDIRHHAIQRGMVTLRMDGFTRACEGLTTVEEILRVTQEDA